MYIIIIIYIYILYLFIYLFIFILFFFFKYTTLVYFQLVWGSRRYQQFHLWAVSHSDTHSPNYFPLMVCVGVVSRAREWQSTGVAYIPAILRARGSAMSGVYLPLMGGFSLGEGPLRFSKPLFYLLTTVRFPENSICPWRLTVFKLA